MFYIQSQGRLMCVKEFGGCFGGVNIGRLSYEFTADVIVLFSAKLCNQVPSLSLSRWRNFTLEKIKIDWVLLCIKLQTIVSCQEEYCESMHSYIIAPDLSIFSTKKISMMGLDFIALIF